MKALKRIDLWGQAALIGTSLLCLLVNPAIAFNGYFAVGGWQVLSVLVHWSLQGKYSAVKDRKTYVKTLLWTLVIGVLMLPVWIIYGFILLLVSPGLAIWYFTICYTEYRLMHYRSLAQLK